MHISLQESVALESVASPSILREPETVTIRGVQLRMDELVSESYLPQARREALHEQLQKASPFPHIVLEGLFNPRLLELIIEEFDAPGERGWSEIKTPYESTRRTILGSRLGPASQLYFDITNSGWFSQWLSEVIGIPYLLTDPKLYGGGLHESRPGAKFAVHRDFEFHPYLGLRNRMVMITYLNKGWQPEWGSALELWDRDQHGCVERVQPEFGRTLILPHGPVSYHGHPTPFQTPDGRPRRSIAAYYYSSPNFGKSNGDGSISNFLEKRRVDRAKTFVRSLVPPILWNSVRKLAGGKEHTVVQLQQQQQQQQEK